MEIKVNSYEQEDGITKTIITLHYNNPSFYKKHVIYAKKGDLINQHTTKNFRCPKCNISFYLNNGDASNLDTLRRLRLKLLLCCFCYDDLIEDD